MKYCKEANNAENFKVSAFGLGQKNPDPIFIDLDFKDFTTPRARKLALNNTLKTIRGQTGPRRSPDRHNVRARLPRDPADKVRRSARGGDPSRVAQAGAGHVQGLHAVCGEVSVR